MTAWVPFAVFIFGIHESAAIFLIAFGSFFPIVVNVAAGARQTPRILIRAARMLGTPPRKLLLRVVLPAALPAIFTGLRVGLGLAWVLVIVAEMLAVQGGLGYALWSAYQFSRLDLILAAIASVGGLGLASDRLISFLAKRVTPLAGREYRTMTSEPFIAFQNIHRSGFAMRAKAASCTPSRISRWISIAANSSRHRAKRLRQDHTAQHSCRLRATERRSRSARISGR